MERIAVNKPLKTYSNTRKAAPKVAEKPKKVTFVVKGPKKVPLTTKRAVELLLSGKLRDSVCRYCLHIAQPLSELDQIMQIGGRGALYSVTIRDMVACFHPFKVVDDINFPNKVCEKCLDHIIQSYLFAQQCEQSERAIRNCFDDMYEKLDKLDPIDRPKKRGRQKLNPNHNILYTEHRKVIDYAEPIRNLINSGSTVLTNEPEMSELECKKCWQLLPNIESLVNHEKMHPTTMWYHCRTCGRSFPKHYQIRRHLRQSCKGKPLTLPQTDKNFQCKQCGFVSDDYKIHLQHIEKHKFQMVLEHLVERNTEKLCAVCLEKDKRMVDLDKMICVHGGFPELMGDRSLYNILGSTVPERNHYKYQELLIPTTANILTITKKPIKSFPKTGDTIKEGFVISPPIIVSRENCEYTESYLFILSEPQMPYEEKMNVTEIIADATRENLVKDITVKPIEEKFQFTFSNPEFVQIKDRIQTNVDINTLKSKESQVTTTNTCKECWIFKKKMCTTCTGLAKTRANEIIPFNISENYTKSNQQMEIVTKEKDDACKFCWIFTKTDKCRFCEKSNNAKEDTNINAITEFKIPQVIIKQVADSKEKQLKKWKCQICLTDNDTDRLKCICCDAENYENGGPIKIELDANHAFRYFNTTENRERCASKSKDSDKSTLIDISQSVYNEITNENMKTIEKVEAPIMEDATEMENDNSLNEKLNKDTEMMEVEEEINQITIPILNQPRNQEILHQERFPNSFNPIMSTSSSLGIPLNSFQFHIGSNFAQRKERHSRNRKPLRRTTSFHK